MKLIASALIFLLNHVLIASSQSDTCVISDKSDTYGPKLIFNCYKRLIVHLVKATKANHVLVEIWPLFDTDNPVSFEWLPRLNESDVKLLQGVTSYTISVYSTDLKEGATYADMIRKMGIPVEEVVEVFLQGCVNFRLKQLEGLRNVWSLYISGSIFNETKLDLGKMFPELRLLSLKLNQFQSPPKIDDVLYLEEFLLDMNEVQSIPDKYFKNNRHLNTIYINELTLEVAPKDLFQGMEYLESLTYRTSLKEFPTFQGCHELQALEVQSPDVKKLSSDVFKDLKGLTTLKLFGCDIIEIDEDSFKHTKELQEIDLSFNQIKALPVGVFKNNTKLRKIDLSYNNLTKFTDAILPNSTRTLNLRYTQVQSFNATKPLPFLEELDISNSDLTGTFDIRNFTKFCPNIRKFNLAGNQLTNVTLVNNFRTKRDRIGLELHDNRIKTVTVVEEERGNSTNGDVLTRINMNLAENPIKCDCYMKRFVQLLVQKAGSFHMNRDVKCTWPGNRTLFTVDLSEMSC